MLIRNGSELPISPKAFEILNLLIENRHRTVTREEILTRVWQDTHVEEGNISFHISNLRKVLGQNGDISTQYIRTVPRKGYRFIAEVAELSAREENKPAEPLPLAAQPSRTSFVVRASLLVLAIFALLGTATFFSGTRFSQFTAIDGNGSQRPSEAQALYAKGKKVWLSRVFGDQDPSELFKQAIDLEPGFAAAHLALADTYLFDPTPERAETAIGETERLAPDIPGLRATRGFVKMFHHWDWAGAEREFREAIAAGEADPKTHHWYGVLLSLHGRNDSAIAQMERAHELDPTLTIISADIGQLHYFSRRYEKAVEHLIDVARIDPSFPFTRRYLADAYVMLGRHDMAFEEILRSRHQSSESVAELRQLFVERGLRGIWESSLQSSDCLGQASQPYECAVLFARLGDSGRTLSALEKAHSQKAFLLPFAKVDPVFDLVRDDRRFRSIMDKIGI